MPSCRIYSDEKLADSQVSIPSANDAHVADGDFVVVLTGPKWSQFARVVVNDATGIPSENRNDIHTATWHGEPGCAGTYQKIRPTRYHLHVFTSSKRASVGLVLMLIAVGLAYLNAALQTTGVWQWYLSPGKWIVLAASAAAAIGAYVKDVWL